jgi:hypothetical protein
MCLSSRQSSFLVWRRRFFDSGMSGLGMNSLVWRHSGILCRSSVHVSRRASFSAFLACAWENGRNGSGPEISRAARLAIMSANLLPSVPLCPRTH